MEQKPPTLYDVARLANVSYQTVSRVVNQQPRVSKETRERVLQAIEQLNYRPNYAAQRLAGSKSKTLAVVTFDMGNYGPVEMMLNMGRHAHKAGYELLSAYVDPYSGDGIPLTADRLLRSAVDGVILIAPVESDYYGVLLDELKAIPIVHVDTSPQNPVPSVFIDQYYGSKIVTQHLLDLGHRHLCEIHGPMVWFGARSRHQAFIHTLAKAGLTPVATIEGDWSPASGYQAALELIERHQFTAIVAGNDHMAMGVLSALAEKGRRVPQDVSVVGFDDVAEAPYYMPPLTTVRQDFVELGITALDYLLDEIDKPSLPPQQKSVMSQLIRRKSSAAPP